MSSALHSDQYRARRELVAKARYVHGIDFIEVMPSQTELHVHFIQGDEEKNESLHRLLHTIANNPSLIEIVGNTQRVGIKEVDYTAASLKIVVHASGGFSNYLLKFGDLPKEEFENPPVLDPIIGRREFSFKATCVSTQDCLPRQTCDGGRRHEPIIDYLAKDYASFRRALLDWLPTLMPSWQERLEADFGITLVELLAYVADNLSYYQDAVANEAWLETARQRISVRRHARLIDYRMHDGASARLLVMVKVSQGSAGVIPRGTTFLPRIERSTAALRDKMNLVKIDAAIADDACSAASVVFEAIADTSVDSELNELKIHSWLREEYCLPKGATSLDLMGDFAGFVKVGNLLLLEEMMVLRPSTATAKQRGTGATPDSSVVSSEQTRRHLVRVTEVDNRHRDPLAGIVVTRIFWSSDDALPFDFCVKSSRPLYHIVGVVRGNLVLADHGQRIKGELHSGPIMADDVIPARAHRIHLNEGPLSFRVPITSEEGSASARTLMTVEPHRGRPQVRVDMLPPDEKFEKELVENWYAQPDLLAAGPFDNAFMVETDNEGRAVLRFGLDEFGRAPPQNYSLAATYRIGVGTVGNIGSGVIAHFIPPDSSGDLEPPAGENRLLDPFPAIESVTNPLPGWGGIDPETIEHVKETAPAAIHHRQFRAVTADDYAEIAQRHPEVGRAMATIRWTGSWQTVFVTIDPQGRIDLNGSKLLERLKTYVQQHALAGYDVDVEGPNYVPLDLAFSVQVDADQFSDDVESEILKQLSDEQFPDGKVGFFHPDNFTFGQPLYLSALLARIESVPGVVAVILDADAGPPKISFRRQDESEAASVSNLERGSIEVSRLEVIRVDNDQRAPENGLLRLTIVGGK
jgi:hypothetical protein